MGRWGDGEMGRWGCRGKCKCFTGRVVVGVGEVTWDMRRD
jgi:hypothetical protein